MPEASILEESDATTQHKTGDANAAEKPPLKPAKDSATVMIQKQMAAAFADFRPAHLEDATPLRAALATPNQIHQYKIDVILSDGKRHSFNGFRVQHNNLLGPYKGGLRFHPLVEVGECTALATWMTMKTALVGLPLGGGKGGVDIDTRAHSAEDVEIVAREFGRLLAPVIGDTVDVPAPDVGSNPNLMIAMLDEYNQRHGTDSPGTFTGKPVDQGGSLWRNEATGYGVALSTRSILDGDVAGKTFAIQGMGNVGYFAAKFLTEWGMLMVAAGDHTGYRQGSLELPKVGQFVADMPQGVEVGRAEFFATECDVLIPAALELQIDAEVANSLNCQYVVEAANGPTTPDGEAVLDSRGIKIVPDVLANSGGVIVSYYEWLQNCSGQRWTEAKVQTQMEELIVPTVDALRDHKGNSRVFCYHKALRNLEAAFVTTS